MDYFLVAAVPATVIVAVACVLAIRIVVGVLSFLARGGAPSDPAPNP